VTRPVVVAIVGPTAAGKSDLAIRLAVSLGGEVISVDSRLLYRGMDIGTAKPSVADRARVPHHLIDIADPDEMWSLARFQQAVRRAIEDVGDRGRLPILVGGTGQYMRGVLEGWAPPPPADAQVRARLEAEARRGGAAALVRRLEQVDPASAEAIDPRNVRRVIRALEIFEATGVPASRQRGRAPPPFRALRVGWTRPRPELYARIDARIDDMIRLGLVDEVRGLLARGYARDLPSMSAIGYREIAAHLAGEITLDEAIRRMRQATRRFVRRQGNWFRADDPSIRWFTAGPEAVAEVERWIREETAPPSRQAS